MNAEPFPGADVRVVDAAAARVERWPRMPNVTDLEPLLAFIERVPAIRMPAGRKSLGHGCDEVGIWWVKFSLDTRHPLAWRVVQELGYVLNYVSLQERLPTVFKPVSPPPYMNGGVEFLSWVIENTDPLFTPSKCSEWLEGRLPQPVSDLDAWNIDDDEDEDEAG